MASTTDLSNGLVIRLNNELCEIQKYQHVMPGKGGAFYQVKLKNIQSGKGFEHRFRSGESIDIARIEKKEMQYIYDEGENLVLMDTETYEQISIPRSLVPKNEIVFLKESTNLFVSFENERALFANLPTFIELEVTYSEPALRGDTSNSPSKRVTVETGATLDVPLFVNTGDKLKIDTRIGEYVERIK